MNPSLIIGATLGFVAGIIVGGFAKADETKVAERIPAAQVETVAAKVRAYLTLEGHPPKSPLPFPVYQTLFSCFINNCYVVGEL